jgi:hypothetical protein
MTDYTCPACVAHLAHYPSMADEWDCEHDRDEQAFMLAMADAIHGPDPKGEFTDPGWRAAMFLDDAEVALNCGPAPYVMQVTHNVDPWSFMALVNGRHLIGTRNDEGAELEHIADIGWLTEHVRAAAIEGAANAVTGVFELEAGYTHDGWGATSGDIDAHYAKAIRALTIRPERKD